MFHMLSWFDLNPGTTLADFEIALNRYLDHMLGRDLVVGRDPVGLRQTDTIMDTDEERGQRYFMLMHFRDRAQCDAAVAYIHQNEEPVSALHAAVYTQAQNMIFLCWQDIA